ncbi:MAG: NADH-quinone oxidoreductase subunit J [Gammaproteobacteria bacterium]|nr:NADH-quinone oxidoreductase subunit J [Gammaproteobacteria bacterium]
MFYLLGAPFAAALQILIYAGAIMVLFLFVVMMLDLGRATVERERRWLAPGIWTGPGLISAVLFGALMWALIASPAATSGRPVPGRARWHDCSTVPGCWRWSSRPSCCSPVWSGPSIWGAR